MAMIHLARRLSKRLAVVGRLAIVLSTLSVGSSLAGSWDHPHGDAANSGFADVSTKVATTPSFTVASTGTYAVGVGPVLGPSGTIYLGNQQGVLRAIQPNGTTAWQRALGSGNRIVASPVVDTDGSIYVVGQRTFNSAANDPPRRTDSTLFRLDPSDGHIVWASQFPVRYASTQAANRGATSASPNIWRYGSDAAVMVPVVYGMLGGGSEFRLLAFQPTYGAVLSDQLVTMKAPGPVTSSSPFGTVAGCVITFCWFEKLSGFSASPYQVPPAERLLGDPKPPMAGLAIYSAGSGALPWLVVSDPWKATVGYRYQARTGFSQAFRRTDSKRAYATTPMVVPGDGHSAYGIASTTGWAGLAFAPPNTYPWPDVHATSVFGTPAATLDHRVVAVALDGWGNAVRDGAVVQQFFLGTETIAPPAVSRSHVFVSTATSLRTLNATTLAELGRFAWRNGGLSSPAIGPQGQVYVLADHVLYGFAGPSRCQIVFCGPQPPVVGGLAR